MGNQRRDWLITQPGVSHASGSCVASPAGVSPLAAILAGNVLKPGELVLLVIKPSLWFIVLSSLRFIAAVAIVAVLAAMADPRLAERRLLVAEVAIFITFGRLTWATLQWIGMLYVLTDRRVISLSGVFHPLAISVALPKIERVDLQRSTRERIFRLGTLLLVSPDIRDIWQMIARPREVQATIRDAIDRARRSGFIAA